jgi:glutathione synthase/RimK-type ligase-like ATP-grasp enzyme
MQPERVSDDVGENRRAIELYRAGDVLGARERLEALVRRSPKNALAWINLGFVRFHAGDVLPAQRAYETALQLDERSVQAHHGIAAALEELGDREGCLRHFDIACRLAPIRGAQKRDGDTRVRVLVLLSASLGNLNAFSVLDDAACAVTAAFVEYVESAEVLPAHDVAFNGIGVPEIAEAALRRATDLLATMRAPVINPPERIMASTRIDVARRLGGTNEVRVPKIALVPRAGVRASVAALGFTYPLLVRSPGFHNGRNFELVKDDPALEACVRELPGETLYLIEFVDVRSPDGNVRKYRAIVVGDRIFPLHLAIAKHWKVHYVTADMGDAAHQAEERGFLEDMEAALGDSAMAALERVGGLLGLEYGGIDFGIDAHGRLTIFEANAAMVVPHVNTDPQWSYRRGATDRIRNAMTALLRNRARFA